MLDIDLDNYDAIHEALLKKGVYQTLNTAARVKKFKATGKIPRNDFLNYFLIHRFESAHYATYHQRMKHIDEAVIWTKYVLDTTSTIKSLPGCSGLQERVGEAVSLSVASSMFNLTTADWTVIPIQGGRKAQKTFDFERIMVGIGLANEIIQVEAKGSFVSDNSQKPKKILNHAASIQKKKTKIANSGTAYKHPAAARYGVIAAVDGTRTAKCWLLDPPPEPFEGEPSNGKIASRLEYVASTIELIAPNAKLPTVIRDCAKQWGDFRRSEPVDPIGTPYTLHNYVERYLANKKIWIEKMDIVGQLYVGTLGDVFFIGLVGAVVRDAIKQDAATIAAARYETSVKRVTIEGSPVDITDGRKADRLTISLDLHIDSGGTVIGVTPARRRQMAVAANARAAA